MVLKSVNLLFFSVGALRDSLRNQGPECLLPGAVSCRVVKDSKISLTSRNLAKPF